MRRIKRLLLPAGLILWASLPCSAQTVTPTPETGITPNTLLLYRADLANGKEAAYEQAESAVVRSYESAKIPVYWIALESLTNAPHVLYFDGFDSFADIEKTSAIISQGLKVHPDLAALQKKLLDAVTATRTTLAFRRDDLGYRLNKLDLSKAHYVRVSTYQFRPGFEDEFATTVRGRARSFEASDIDAPWMIYQVHSGTEIPGFIEFQPMESLSEIDEALDRAKRGRHVPTDTRQLAPQQWMREAEFQTASEIYSVSATMSHAAPQEDAAAATRGHPDASRNGGVARQPRQSSATASSCCTQIALPRVAAATVDGGSRRE